LTAPTWLPSWFPNSWPVIWATAAAEYFYSVSVCNDRARVIAGNATRKPDAEVAILQPQFEPHLPPVRASGAAPAARQQRRPLDPRRPQRSRSLEGVVALYVLAGTSPSRVAFWHCCWPPSALCCAPAANPGAWRR
jgi:hypothetical protein